MRIALVVYEEKCAVFEVENFRDIDRASQAAAPQVKAISTFGKQSLRPVDGNQRIQSIIFEEIVKLPVESVGPRFGGRVEVGKIAAILGGEIRNSDFYLADGFRRWLEAGAAFIVLVRVHAIDVVSVVA